MWCFGREAVSSRGLFVHKISVGARSRSSMQKILKSYKQGNLVADLIDKEGQAEGRDIGAYTIECELPVDRIAVAGCARLRDVLGFIGKLAWGSTIQSCFFPPAGLQGWCGWSGEHVRAGATQGDLLQELEGSVLETVRSKARGGRSFGRLRKVPKDDRVARVVANMRALNAVCSAPPKYSLVSLDEFFHILLKLGPAVSMITFDYRHWFYQLPLPQRVRILFSFWAIGGRVAQLCAWCMGFAWTPFVAQGVAVGLLAMVGVHRLGLRCPELESRAMPPWLTFWEGERIVCIVVVWADNSFVAPVDSWRDRWVTAMQREFDSLASRVVVKEGSWHEAKGQVTFMGVEWKWVGGRLKFKLPEDNVARWMATAQRPEAGPRGAAAVAGIVYWLWIVEGGKLGSIREAVELSRCVATVVLHQGGWDAAWAAAGAVMEPARRLLLQKLEGAESWRERSSVVIFDGRTVRFVNSDASGKRIAGVRWGPGKEGQPMPILTVDRALSRVEQGCHINVIETVAGIEVLEEELVFLGGASPLGGKGAPLFSIVLGVDNRSAVKALSVGFFPGQEMLSERIWSLVVRMERSRITSFPMWVPGIYQVADEATRDRAMVGEAFATKAATCWKLMKEAVEVQIEREKLRGEADVRWRETGEKGKKEREEE